MAWNQVTWALSLALPLAVGLWALARPHRHPNLCGHLVGSVGWIIALMLPLTCVQLVSVIRQGSEVLEALLLLPLVIWMNLGGWTVQRVFEATAKPLFGSRQSTLSHSEWYTVLAGVQVVLLALVVALRRARGARWTDPVVLLVGALALGNALLGMNWPWWGT